MMKKLCVRKKLLKQKREDTYKPKKHCLSYISGSVDSSGVFLRLSLLFPGK